MKMMILSDEVGCLECGVVLVMFYSHDETVLIVRDDVRCHST